MRHRTLALVGTASIVSAAMIVAACLPDRRTLLEDVADDGAGDAKAGDANADTGCIDPTGFGGRGCFRCPPTTNDEFLNACTTSRFEVFDNQMRMAGFDPKNPRPALVDGGPGPPPFDAGVIAPDDAGSPTNPPCPIDTKPNPVMVLGSTGFPLEDIAKAMGGNATVFYAEKGSCGAVASMILGDPKLAGDIVYYDSATGKPVKCTLAESHPADIAVSALFAENCADQAGLPSSGVQLPPGVTDFLGPANVIMFAVPFLSTQRAISAEAAYRAYGFGNNSGAEPWTNENFIFRRTKGSGNQQVVANTLQLPADALRGTDSNGSSNMLPALQSSSTPERTIGISASEIVDPNRTLIRALAYEHYGQSVAFYPDSDSSSFDRRNVRDGHYFMWTPLHLFVRTKAGDPVAADNTVLDPDGSKRASRDAAVKLLTLVMASRQEAPVRSVDLFGALKKVGNVPQCAMRVTRATVGGTLERFTPSRSCACAFEAASPGMQPPECDRCIVDTDCKSPSRRSCYFGFCE